MTNQLKGERVQKVIIHWVINSVYKRFGDTRKIVLLSGLIFLDDIVYQLLLNQKEYSLEEVSFIFLEN